MVQFCDRRRKLFFDDLARHGIVSHAADVAGVNLDTIYNHRDRNPVFRKKMEQARERSIDRLEKEAERRAVDGVEDVVVSGGKVVRHRGKVLKRKIYSDRLMALLLRAKRPKEFRDNLDITSDGRPINVNVNIGVTKKEDKK